jgi:hypothetical protein
MTKPKNPFLAVPGTDPVDLIGYLRTCSDPMLEQFEMARLSTAANLSRQLNVTIQRAVNDLAEAMLARTVREHRKAVLKAPAKPTGAQEIMADLVQLLPPAVKQKRKK